MTSPSDPEKSDFKIEQQADGSLNVTQPGYVEGDVLVFNFPAPADPADVEAKMKHIEPILEARRQQAAREAEQRASRPRQRVVNALPFPDYFRDREAAREKLVGYLADDGAHVIAIIGRGGMGKTALAGKVLDDLANGRIEGAAGLDGVVYLSGRQGSGLETGLTVDRIFRDVGRLLGGEAADALDAIWRDNASNLAEKTLALLDHLSGGRYALVLDNLEDLLDDRGEITDGDLRDFLVVCLSGRGRVQTRLILTSRERINVRPEHRIAFRHVPLHDGLPEEDAVQMLKDLDRDGECGLCAAPDAKLGELARKTQGVPRALELAAAILSDPFEPVTLDALLARDDLFDQHVADKLAREAYRRLDADGRRVLEALAVFNAPVDPVAVEFLLAPWTPRVDVPTALHRLVAHHHVTRDNTTGRYSLHPIDQAYAYRLLPEAAETASVEAISDEPERDWRIAEFLASMNSGPKPDSYWQNEPYTRHNLELRAADFFAANRLPKEQWKTIADLEPQLQEFDHRLSAEDYDAACRLLNDIDFNHLMLWGYSRRVVPMREALLGKLSSKRLQEFNNGSLGSAYYVLGRVNEAIPQYEQALQLAHELSDKQNEGVWLGNVGNAYSDLGDVRRAIEYYEQVLVIAREIGDRRSEGAVLGNLGLVYTDDGRIQDAINAAQQAVRLAIEINYPYGQCKREIVLGWALLADGQDHAARDAFYEAAALDVVDTNHEASVGLGIACARLVDKPGALAAFREAVERAQALIEKTKDYYGAWYTFGLAQTGLAALGAGPIEAALDAYRRAVALAPHAGILAVARRELDELAKAPGVDGAAIAAARAVLEEAGA